MHEKVEHLFTQKPQIQNKLLLPLLSLLLQILFNVHFSIQTITSNIINKFNRFFNSLFIFFDRNFRNFLTVLLSLIISCAQEHLMKYLKPLY